MPDIDRRQLVVATLLLLAGFVAWQGGVQEALSVFQPTGGEFQTIEVNGQTCTSRSDCQQLLVEQENVVAAEEFEQGWERSTVRCNPECEIKVPPTDVEQEEVN